ncbi:hypothetical protein NGM37_06000, partial [Streptomyces sp. TRM76130]|nr:hypothetical protein [Streptomyces sp. TRM76130]
MRAYTTSDGVDGADLLAELTAWHTAVDPAAAATRNWGYVLKEERQLPLPVNRPGHCRRRAGRATTCGSRPPP